MVQQFESRVRRFAATVVGRIGAVLAGLLRRPLPAARPADGVDAGDMLQSTADRRHFWEEFRAGQQMADERMAREVSSRRP